MTETEPGFEAHLGKLEEAVRRLESGEETLAGSIAVYEAAVGHLKACHEALEAAEERVRILTGDGEEEFEAAEEN